MLKTGAVFFFLSQIPDSLQYLGQAKHDYGLDRAAELSLNNNKGFCFCTFGMIICSALLRYIPYVTWWIKEQMWLFFVCTKKNIPECFMTIFIQNSKCNMSVHLVKLALQLLRFHACVGKKKPENQMCTFQLWHLFLTWQTCFPAPRQPNTSQALRMWWSHPRDLWAGHVSKSSLHAGKPGGIY